MSENLTLETMAYDAMCLWEAFLEKPGLLDSFRTRHGTSETRVALTKLVQSLGEGWRACDPEAEGCFDWTFTPWFLENCVVIDETRTELALRADWLDRCKAWKGMA